LSDQGGAAQPLDPARGASCGRHPGAGHGQARPEGRAHAGGAGLMRIDCHVHVVGNGTGGTGCWYRPLGLTKLGAPFMLRGVGLTGAALRGDLDGLYAERLVHYVRESSLDAAVILAHEEAYRENGDKVPDSGSFYVPNGHVLNLAARHPELLPAVSIHPARADAMEELER